MRISVYNELQLFTQEIQHFLYPNILGGLARGVGFIQIISRQYAENLVALCIWIRIYFFIYIACIIQGLWQEVFVTTCSM